MEKITQILIEEHKKILIVSDKIEKECEYIKKGGKINEEFFKKAIEFIRNYADKFHHAKEEDILFEEFCKTAEKGCLHCNPVEQMLYEHNIGRDFVKEMEEGIKKRNKRKIIENALGYVNLIREHIFKEDNILYPMAEKTISKEIQIEMLKKFQEIEKSNHSTINKSLSLLK